MSEQCPDCLRWFKSKPALNTHRVRSHGKGWSTTKNFHGGKKSRSADLARKRAYNAKVRAENIAKGLTSSGKPRKRRRANSASLANLHRGGFPWSAERRAKFERTWRAKNQARNNHKVGIIDDLKHEAIPDPRAFINCCPNCGYNLKAHYLAAGFKTT
jgi:hypothetical protein